MKILKVNNRDCSAMDLEDLLALLKESTGLITVLAEDVAGGGAAKPRGSISSVASAPASVPAQRCVQRERLGLGSIGLRRLSSNLTSSPLSLTASWRL